MTDKEIVEKRKGKFSATGDILSGKAGRKVFVGVWVIVMANVWFGLSIHLYSTTPPAAGGVAGMAVVSPDMFVGITQKGYLVLTILGVLLIGFGTIMDTLVSELGHKAVDVLGVFASARAGVIASKVTQTTEVTNVATTDPAKP